MAGIETAADRLEVLSDLDFGETIHIDGTPVACVFYKLYVDVFETEGNSPAAMVRSADVVEIAHDQVVTRCVDGVDVDYVVRGVQPDGTGMTILRLVEKD